MPKSLEYWYMHSGVPLSVSGGNSSFRTARTKHNADVTNEAARVTWLFRAGVGSSSRRKKGLRFRTTELSKLRNESYPKALSASNPHLGLPDLQNCSM